MRDAVIGEPPDRLAAGPVWVGGFAFFPDGGRDPQWASLPATLLVLPEVSLARTRGRDGRDGQRDLPGR